MPKKAVRREVREKSNTFTNIFLVFLVALILAFALYAYRIFQEDMSFRVTKKTPVGSIAPSPTPALTTFNDALPPSLAVSSVADESENADGKMMFQALASDNKGISHVEFYAGEKIICRDLIAPFECSWKPESEEYTIEVKAYDFSHNMKTATINSTDNPAAE